MNKIKSVVLGSVLAMISVVVSLPHLLRNSGKTAKTRQLITLTRQGGTPRFVAHIKGKGSSLPFAAGAMSEGDALIPWTTMLGQAMGTGEIAEALGMAGAVVGGVAVVAAVPVTIGAGVFALVSIFSADTCIPTRVVS